MTARSSRSFVWLLAGAAALAAGIVLLLTLTATPADPGGFELPGAAPATRAAAPAQAVAQSRRERPEPAARRQAEPAAAVRAAPGFDERYLGALAGLRGRIVVKDRGPLAGLPVDLFRASAMPFLPALDSVLGALEPPAIRVGSVRTEADGRFSFAALQPRSFHVLQLGAGTGRATVRIVDRSPGPGEVIDLGDIELPLGATLTGVLTDEDGAPVEGARVCVADFPAVAFSAGLAWLDPDGALLLRNVPAPGTKVIAFPAWAVELERNSPLPEATTDAEGAFRLEGVPPGRPSIWVRRPGLVPLVHGPVASEDGKEKKLGTLVMKRGATISGQVVDGSGTGVAGIEVLAGPVGLAMVPLTFLRPCGETDAKGRFEIGCVGREKLMVVARRAPGDPWVSEGPLEPDDQIVLRIEEPGSIRVLAVAPGGAAPVPDASVSVVAATEFTEFPGIARELGLAQRATAAEDGSIRITGLRAGEYRVLVQAPGHVAAGEKVKVDGPGERLVRVELPRQVTGKIVVVEDATSEPVAFADVVARTTAIPHAGLVPRGLPFRIGTTDAAGEVSVSGLPAGSHPVHVAHPRYGVVPATLVLPGAPLTVRMPAAGSVAGVLTRNGMPPGEPYVIALEQRHSIDLDPPVLTWTDADGHFWFRGVAPGSYSVTVMPHLSRITSITDAMKLTEFDDREHARGNVQVTAGQEAHVTLNLEGAGAGGPTGRITGQVFVNGMPAAGLQVNSWSRRRVRATTDAAGRFELKDVRAGEHIWLSISDGRGDEGMSRHLASRSLQVKEGETVDIQISVQTGHFRGRAIMAHDGSPVAGLPISASRQQTEAGGQDSSHYQVTTDETGRFSVRDCVTGRYLLSVQSEERTLTEAVWVDVRPGEESSEVELRLIAGFKVSGVVEFVPPLEKRAEWQWIHFQGREGGAQGKGAQIGDGGRFEVTALAPGKYDAHVYASEQGQRETVEVEVTGTMTGLHLKFGPAKRRRGVTVETAGEKKDG
jgi:protocatechuate 3,4-dioxygenase beta subunit